MAYYYLVAGLPDLVFGERPAMTMQEFRDVCDTFLTENNKAALFGLLDGELDPEAPEPVAAWADIETQVKNAGARALARKAGLEPAQYERPHGRYFAEAEYVVSEALGAGNPLERESSLDRGRWKLAEELSVGDPFGFGAVVSYGIRLKIAWRWATLDKDQGGEVVDAYIGQALSEYAGYEA